MEQQSAQDSFHSSVWKRKVPSTIAAPVLLGAVAFAVLIAYLVIKSQENFKQGVPTSTRRGTTVNLKTEYKNPFDKSSQYVNPFSKFKNPFDNLR